LPDEDLRESRYTAPTPTCPHPEWWHSSDVDSTEHEVTEMIAGLVRALQPAVVVETGTAWGQTTVAIARALLANGHGFCWSLEVDEERVKASRERLRREVSFDAPADVVQIPSLDFLPPIEPVDFAFFDSLIELRVPEFLHLHPHFAPGAFVVFHDTADHHGLWPSIEALEDAGKLLPIRLPTPRGVVIGEVVQG
jgi:predicted O-methyltransferase YrrM